MSAARHTPGPWRHNGLPDTEWSACAVWAGETPVADCQWKVGRYGPVDDATAAANARLISAAPDLLAAAANAESLLAAAKHLSGDGVRALAQLRAAIARAEGRS